MKPLLILTVLTFLTACASTTSHRVPQQAGGEVGKAAVVSSNIKASVYTQIGSFSEICSVTAGYIFVDGNAIAMNANLGKVFTIPNMASSRIVIRDISPGRKSNECNKLVVERPDGSKVKLERIPENSSYEFSL